MKIQKAATFKSALLEGELVVYYQPIIDNITNQN